MKKFLKKWFGENHNSQRHTPADVGEFYNKHNDAFLKVYGEIIQAFRTIDTSVLLDHEAKSMELRDGQKVLDAGCGVCGPSVYFAEKFNVSIDAITISSVQAKDAENKIHRSNLKGTVRVFCGDYHQVDKIYGTEQFDLVYFLESFGHSPDMPSLLRAVWETMKPGATFYIKDLFIKKGSHAEVQKRIEDEVIKINKAYKYNIADLNQLLDILRKMGFIISFVKTIDIPLQEFENLAISNEFQELTGIAKITDWNNYIFPVDFFEIKCIKPWYDLNQGNGRYFLQNLYYMQIKGMKKEEL